ncbi:ABC transporter ATP-binding protein [Oceanobacillus bengalensis]|uniref:ABC transporter ATP-binding protein n=1 Tax=Oceanobacillus bengalensis TaxID=1435466 RepID=A0A494YX59_9BACI|nr:ABC transporter ATP-binding protein [Oceanobacillus bengalensis]RKQ14793.1 ABC transporter ATP-binding protein [Oceanobacillus bengalensis]
MNTPLLAIDHLDVSFQFNDGKYKALENITFSVADNEVVGIVGESGCGKSLTAQAILGILPENACIDQGSITFKGANLVELEERKWEDVRGKSISMIFQEPMTALNPLLTIGKQISEVLKKHTNLSKAEIRERTIAMMREVGLPRAEALYKSYPHQLSGGMRQRVVIAMALIVQPDLIIADEPTTALDVTIQAQILELFKQIKETRKASMMFISHDWGVIRSICDRVLVMYAGRIVEEGSLSEILQNPKHPYTKGLIEAIPDHRKRGKALFTIPGKVPPLKERKGGCPFTDRCSRRMNICAESFPDSVTFDSNKEQTVNCHLYSKEGVLTS